MIDFQKADELSHRLRNLHQAYSWEEMLKMPEVGRMFPPVAEAYQKLRDRQLVYLAVPYSHPKSSVRMARFEAVNKAAAVLMAKGIKIFSPISQTHPIAVTGQMPLSWDYWHEYDRLILMYCKKLMILKLDGWDQSKGVAGETEIAKDYGLEIEYVEPADLGVEQVPA